MGTAPLTEVVEAVQHIAVCPLCELPDGSVGSGYADSMANMIGPGPRPNKTGTTMPVCRVCKGRKFVYLNQTCECGSPAVFYDKTAKVWYCGRETCKNYAKTRLHRPHTGHTVF